MSGLRSPRVGVGLLDEVEAEAWHHRLGSASSACGCRSGTLFALAAVVAWPIRIVMEGTPHGPLNIGTTALVYLLVVFASGGVGKITGIASGRIRHRWLRHRLARRLRHLSDRSGRV